MTKVTSGDDPAKSKRSAKSTKRAPGDRVKLPPGIEQLEVSFGDRQVKLTNLNKLFWPELKITKRTLALPHRRTRRRTRRIPHQFRNAQIAELPNGDFAFSIARLFLVSVASDQFWRSSVQHDDPDIAAIAAKAEKETAYHVRHAADWLVRLGDGTDESHRRAQTALNALWPYTGDISDRTAWLRSVSPILTRATLTQPADGWMQSGGRDGRHTEHLGHLLAEMQILPRTYPGATW